MKYKVTRQNSYKTTEFRKNVTKIDETRKKESPVALAVLDSTAGSGVVSTGADSSKSDAEESAGGRADGSESTAVGTRKKNNQKETARFKIEFDLVTDRYFLVETWFYRVLRGLGRFFCSFKKLKFLYLVTKT